jgi:hypothetical protein
MGQVGRFQLHVDSNRSIALWESNYRWEYYYVEILVCKGRKRRDHRSSFLLLGYFPTPRYRE